MTQFEREVGEVIAAVRRVIPVAQIDLPDEFYPAHLSVALIDTVFRPRLKGIAVKVVESYCERFGITRTRTHRGGVPSEDSQETLSALIRHYQSVGLEAMVREVYQVAGQKYTPTLGNARKVLRAGKALTAVGIERLEDVTGGDFDAIAYALQARCQWSDVSTRRFLTSIAREDYVLCDLHVRSFTARALGAEMISSARTKRLVRAAAYELIVSPRFLDYQIWARSASEKGGAILRDRD